MKSSLIVILTGFLLKLWEKWDRAFRAIFLFFIQIYKVALRPYFGQSCCYQPSCSSYAHQAFKNYNVFKALYLTIFRLLRCHPLSQGGLDPVPGVQNYE